MMKKVMLEQRQLQIKLHLDKLKKVKDWHSRAKHKTEVKTDQNHCIKSLEVKLFRKKNLIKLSLVFRKSFKLDNDKFSLLKEPVENDIEPGTSN
jgi:hypothetical protein